MTPSSIDRTASESLDVSERSLSRLRVYNAAMGLLHLVSASAMVVLANDFSVEVSAFTLNGPPGTPLDQGSTSEVWSIPLAWGTAGFLFLSAFFHFLIASPWGFGRYGNELRAGRNRFRWVEYSLSASLMLVLIALITGVTDIAALIAIVGANVAMMLFGWIMEMVNPPGRTVWWSPFWFGCVAGIAPWVALVASLTLSASRSNTGGPPTFVYGIIATIFVAFNCFAVNQWLQYRKVGKWADYLYGESVYVALSLVAKSLLAWQIFANTLIE